MARYDKYIKRIEVDLESKLIYFVFDTGESMYFDNGELAEILIRSGEVR